MTLGAFFLLVLVATPILQLVALGLLHWHEGREIRRILAVQRARRLETQRYVATLRKA